jgi:hypothetical protein
MWDFTIRLGDKDGENFQIMLSLPLFGSLDDGTWKTLDFGHIVPIGGYTEGIRNKKNFLWWDMRFYPSQSNSHNARIRFYGIFGPNGFAKEGEGKIHSSLCTTFTSDLDDLSQISKEMGRYSHMCFGWVLD